MLAAEKLDGIVAAQPFNRHAVLLPEIYRTAKYLFTEKPLAVSVEAGETSSPRPPPSGRLHAHGRLPQALRPGHDVRQAA